MADAGRNGVAEPAGGWIVRGRGRLFEPLAEPAYRVPGWPVQQQGGDDDGVDGTDCCAACWKRGFFHGFSPSWHQ